VYIHVNNAVSLFSLSQFSGVNVSIVIKTRAQLKAMKIILIGPELLFIGLNSV